MRNFEKDYLKAHKTCDYCKTMGAITRAEKIVPRQIGKTKYYIALCRKHYNLLREIESEG